MRSQLTSTEVWKKLIKIVSMEVYLILKMHHNSKKRNKNLRKILIMILTILKVRALIMNKLVKEDLANASKDSNKLLSLMQGNQLLVC